METKHTKGKAKLFNECFKNEYDFYVHPISITGDNSILFANAYGKSKEKAIANARLIASAPEMLKMLMDIRNNRDYDFDKIDLLISKITE